jgi:hypothetical protein
MPVFLDFTLCGLDELLPLSQSRQSVLTCTSGALRLLGRSIASQDNYPITGVCPIMTELADPFSIAAVPHLT